MLNRNFSNKNISNIDTQPNLSFNGHSSTVTSYKGYKSPQDDSNSEGAEGTNNNSISLNGTCWYEYELDDSTQNSIEFSDDGFSGNYGTPFENYQTQSASMTYLTYTKNGNDIIIYMGSDTTTGKLSRSYRSQPENFWMVKRADTESLQQQFFGQRSPINGYTLIIYPSSNRYG